MAVPPPRLPACYSPSVFSTPSWRDSATTLFEEDIQPIGLARASTIIRVDSNKSTAGLLELTHVDPIGRLQVEGDIRSFLNATEDLLNRTAKGPAGQACERLWDELLIYTYETSKSTIKYLQ
ncbi:hypothetical protein J1614_005310 [Plenodomus biglobosus]|nr:hypothetical protein J1614_005310 [Plenodomus biglobosus]